MNDMTDTKRKELLEDIIKDTLVDTYTCSRVWDAWAHNTMSEDDFHHAPDDEDLVDEMVYKILMLFQDE